MLQKQKSILIVDDEEKIIEFVEAYLENSGYAVFKAFNGKDALDIFQKEKISLILLDLMLPDITGEDICKRIRRTSKVPIIMLTAKIKEESILKGLDLGADDYITKPFSPRQLVARIGALLRRTEGNYMSVSNLLTFNNKELVIDITDNKVRKKGEVVNLTPKEFNILYTMARRPNKIYTREELIVTALGEAFTGMDRTVDSHIKNLRKKIEEDPKKPEYILTTHGIGYKFGGDQS